MKLQEVVSLSNCSLRQLLSAIKPVSVLGRAVMALLFLLFLPVESHAFLLFEICVITDLSPIINSLNRSVRDG